MVVEVYLLTFQVSKNQYQAFQLHFQALQELAMVLLQDYKWKGRRQLLLLEVAEKDDENYVGNGSVQSISIGANPGSISSSPGRPIS
jgi:hypothetical protein